MKLALITIVSMVDMKVRMKIIGQSDAKTLPHFNLSSKLVGLDEIPDKELVLRLAAEVGFGGDGPIAIISEAEVLPEHRFDVANFNPLLMPLELGYCHVVYIHG